MEERQPQKKSFLNTGLLVGICIVLITLLVLQTLILTRHNQANNVADWVVAIGTVVLAMAAFASILFSRAQEAYNRQASLESEERRRKADVQREERERKERLLNEIKDWASEITKSAIGRQKRPDDEYWKTELEYKLESAKGKYVLEIAESCFKDLSPLIISINNKLDEAKDISASGSIRDKSGRSVINYETDITNLAVALLEKLAEIRSAKTRPG